MNLKFEQGLGQKIIAQVHYQDHSNHHALIQAIRHSLPEIGTSPIVVVCIGTDRSTGDALGPLVGSYLERHHLADTSVYGTLEKPVHAMNLQETLALINASHENPFIIGIDACLGRQKNIGKINIAEGPVLPGAGVKKELIPVGDMNITGVVNISGFMEYSVLQNTRLHIVMRLSQVIGQCLSAALLSRRKGRLLSKLFLMD
ncbi:spore protease YyaC [Sporolactobacillus shoreicorticis]|uniref:Spore protease YyaC n=1 Tax=Sporolactobacillus shoreicorticis TaxID=1923877 RepID=A0ABW5SA60_9BACL|nr:spore protease YyaC [Sporolactobacillus shoreicorticis]MCO7126091.1 spore protease YyaC [Sporolactobacillus shoreicorticis]